MPSSDLRQYEVHARTTDTFGRVLCGCRTLHFVADGPVQNDCPGEAITPAELFLSGVAACGIELVQVIARERSVPLQTARVTISGTIDRANPVRPDLSLFNSVVLKFTLTGVTREQGEEIVGAFQKRCPLFGTVRAATPDVIVEIVT
ncbi:MAG: OsmC family protein [Acidobacteriota bacterium]